MRYRWQDVDWVELGCRGWEIDESGAGLHDGGDWSHCHLDRVTGHVILAGHAPFLRRAIMDLEDARLPRLAQPWAFTTTTGTTNILPAWLGR